MTLLTDRPTTAETARNTTDADAAVRGGSYVTFPAGTVPVGVEGSYVTVAGARNLRAATRGSYVTAGGTPVVAASVIEGSYVTLPTAA
ncbi:hypothetical protein GCM10009712_11270 [Pseudarthrobacter sulfonivorans]|uniref:hypothetical protein n=1 Tax=Pseudarthrobacter sulfonivorans TaxID=121292 RepID=UPI00168BA5A3|nr:hypothetical protein [Pseudarthrobacter sulfonivorans]